jgi:ankyrin repeat protein
MGIIEIFNKIEQIRKGSQQTDTNGMPPAVQAKIEVRDLANQTKAKQDLTQLLATISDSQDLDKIRYFKQLVVGYGLTDLLPPDEILPGSTSHPESGFWGHHYNDALYQKILPLCQLAYLEEANGVAEEHALKLSLIFNDEKAICDYLTSFATSTKSQYPVHNACLFDLPSPDGCNFQQWKLIANKKLPNKKSFMSNPRFRELLPHAPAIEAIAKGKEERGVNKKAIITKEKEVQSVTKTYSTIEQTPIANPTEAEKLERKEKLNQLSQEKSCLSIELAELSKNLPLKDASIIIMQAFYESYKANSSPAHSILISHGINTKNIELFNSLKRQNDDQAIPIITIKGLDLGYQNFYLTKLNTQSDKGAAIAACLGKITDCCQYLGGVGTECTKYGIESPDSGFYVLFQGDENNPSLDDRIVAQAWVWRSENGDLCLDSIESIPQASKSQVSDFYRSLGMTLCENPNIRLVNAGAQSGITTKVALKDYPTTKLHTIDYTGYSDSKSQLLLADASMPYAFWGKVESVPLQTRIANNTNHYFKYLFSLDTDINLNEELKKTITYLIYSQQDKEDNPLYQLLLDASGERAEELGRLIGVNRSYIDHLDNNNLDSAYALLDQGAYLNAMNHRGQSILHAAVLAENLILIEQLVEQNINLDIQDKYGNPALINALETLLYQKKSEQGQVIAKYLIEKGANIDIKDKDENTPLIIAVKNQDLDMVHYLIANGADLDTYDGDMKTALFWAAEKGNWELYSELSNRNCRTDVISNTTNDNLLMAAIQGGNKEIILDLINRISFNITYQNKSGQTALHMGAHHPELLSAIFELMPIKQRLMMISSCDGLNNTVLHYAVSNSVSVKTICDLLSEIGRSNLFTAVNIRGETVLHYAAKEPESLRTILERLPSGERLEAVSVCDRDGNSVLHYALSNFESLQIICDLVPQIENSPLLYVPNTQGETVLHWAAQQADPLSLFTLLKLIAVEHRLEAISACKSDGQTVVHCAAGNSDSLKTIRDLVPEIQRLDLFVSGYHSLIHMVTSNPDSLKVVLEPIPDNERFDLFCTYNCYGYTVLHSAVNHPDSLKTILENISENQRIELACLGIKEGWTTALHSAANKPDSLKAILELIPKNQRLQVARVGDVNNNTVLHLAANNPNSLKTILELIPENQRLELVCLRTDDIDGDTVLHLAANNPETLSIILELLPETQRIDAVNLVNKHGYNLLHKASKNLKSLKSIYELYPENQRPEGIGGVNEDLVLLTISDTLIDKITPNYADFDGFYFDDELIQNDNKPLEEYLQASSSSSIHNRASDECYEKLSLILSNSDFIERGVRLKSQLYPNLHELKNALERKEDFSVIQTIAAQGVEKNNEVKEKASPEFLTNINNRLTLFMAITQALNLDEALTTIEEQLPAVCIINKQELQ